MVRLAILSGLMLLAAGTAAGQQTAPAAGQEDAAVDATDTDLQDWIARFRLRAEAAGITPGTLDRALAGVRLNAVVLDRDRNQGEFTRAIWDYLDKAVSDDRIANGKAALARHAALLDRIEAAHGVDKEVVVAIWGLESAYGAVKGDIPVIEALATLAHDTRRAAFFEGELVAALRIIQAGDITPAAMRGSWAGAMGHTQFMPTSYLKLAVDFTGDGRRDIWGDDPADALASTAAYLAHYGWAKGQPWGAEVVLPEGFDVMLAGEGVQKPAAEWTALGVTLADGGAIGDHGLASILLPAGVGGAAFVIYPNFRVIERYNAADAYVIAVGHLADRIRGGGPIRHGWPREGGTLQLAERIELQERLTAAGFDTGGADGKVGPRTVAAVRAFQRSQGLVPDGYASPDILRRLR
jgi:membrane-bound lytic murein transglycosylase B